MATLTLSMMLTTGALGTSGAMASASSRGEDASTLQRAALLASLSGSTETEFLKLSADEQLRTLKILNDPRFGAPGQEAAITKAYPEVNVQRTSATQVAASTCNAWVSQKWSALGITYATVRTDSIFMCSGSRAYDVQRCEGAYTNLIPGRQISYYPTYSNNSDGTITCRTNWTVIKLGIIEDTGAQGFRVDGRINFIRKWWL